MKVAFCVLCANCVLMLGCEDSGSNGLTYSNARLNEARNVIKKMKALAPETRSVAMTASILNEPDFSGVVREWGCVAMFNESGDLTGAKTLKVKDFQTGKRHSVRDYTPEELRRSKEQILKYRDHKGYRRGMAFPIHSESFKLAVAESVLQDRGRFTYAIGRGGGSTSEEQQVLKIIGSSTEVMAADALYM